MHTTFAHPEQRARGWVPSAIAGALAVVTFVAGCSSGGSAETPTASETSSASPSAGPSTLSEGASTATGETSTDSEAAFDWRAHDGVEITVLADQNPWQAAVEPLVPEFEAKTGIKVDFQSLPEDQFRQRRQVVLTGKSSAVDVFMTQPVQDGAQFERAGWYEDLSPYVDESTKVAPDYDFADIGQGLLDSATIGGHLIGLPILVDVEMLYYRKDILKAAGVEPPTTMDELEAIAKKIDDPTGTRGYAARGKGSDAVTQMSLFLYNFGANWTTNDGKAAFASPEGIQAFQFYGDMLRNYAPAGIVNDSWQELMPLFQQGKIAMWDDSSSFLSTILDPAKTEPTVLENIGYARMPAGPGGEFNSTLPWAIAMSSLSEQKDAAWYFIQWATSKEVVANLQGQGVAGGRQSVDFPDSIPSEWADVFRYDLSIAKPKLPVVVPVAEVRDVIGNAIVTCIQSHDSCEAAVQSAAKGFDDAVTTAG